MSIEIKRLVLAISAGTAVALMSIASIDTDVVNSVGEEQIVGFHDEMYPNPLDVLGANRSQDTDMKEVTGFLHATIYP